MELLSPEGRATLLNNRTRSNRDEGIAWVEGLPSTIASVAEQWSLTLQPHFTNLSYNYVAPARRADGELAVLKLCLPDHDFLCEAEATRAFDGTACARLLQADLEAGALLLERLEPGVEVHTLEDDVAETSAVAGVMRSLQRPYAGIFPFPNATEWIDDALNPEAIPRLKAEHPWIARALNRIVEIAAEPYETVLLHGDLHQDNLLLGRGGQWLAIDPKGVIGDPAWELAPFLFNNLQRYPRGDWAGIVRRRADQLAEELSLDRDRVYAWSAVRSIQSAWWSLRDDSNFQGIAYKGSVAAAQALTE